jgi:hypothetical protein
MGIEIAVDEGRRETTPGRPERHHGQQGRTAVTGRWGEPPMITIMAQRVG